MAIRRRRARLPSWRYTVQHPTGPDKHHTYAPTEGLQAVRLAKGLTLEEVSALTNYAVEDLEELEANPTVPVPRIITARISAVMDATHDSVRGYEE